MSNFHIHTYYSVRDAIQSPEAIAKFQKSIGKNWFCVTDHGSMAAHPECFEVAKSLGMNFIAGCEFYVAPDKKFDGKENITELAVIQKELRKKTLSPEDRANYEARRDEITSVRGYNDWYYHLTVFAINQKGLLNLYRINNNGDFYYKTRARKEDLLKYNEGLVILSGCPAGEFLRMIENGYEDLADKWLKDFKEVYGNRLYFELMFHDGVYKTKDINKSFNIEIRLPNPEYKLSSEEIAGILNKTSHKDNFNPNGMLTAEDYIPVSNKEGFYNVKLTYEMIGKELEEANMEEEKAIYRKGIELARKNNIKIVGSNDSHYTTPEDRKYWLITRMAMIGNDKDFTGQYHMLEDNKLFEEAYPGLVTAKELDESEEEIISMFEPYDMFISDYESTLEDKKYFEKLVWTGFKNMREGTEYEEESLLKIPYELAVIQTKDFDRYFLYTRDVVKAAFEKGILVGPGRGSGAGSECVYLLGITATDPIKYELMFERFLNPGRNAMPDIDLDLASEGCENFKPNQEYKDKFFSTHEKLVSEEEIANYWKKYHELKLKHNDTKRDDVLRDSNVPYFEGFVGDHFINGTYCA